MRKKILAWYARAQRDLPWRATEDPYAIWVSEIMLQQTQVATVRRYFGRFIERFPDVATLARAEDAEVMRYWEGLGYYRRARQMLDAARKIVAEHQGVFPGRFEEVLQLPGIGRYTAGAICSFAYNQSTPIVEANTQRLYARLLGYRGPLHSREGQSQLWGFAEQMLEAGQARQLNYAAMELGALICQPQPACEQCPLNQLCPTLASGDQDKIPAPKPRVVYEAYAAASLIVTNRNREFLLRQCGPDEWWTGLWDFPRGAIDAAKGKVQEVNGLRFELLTPSLLTIRHSVTRYRITLDCFRAKLVPGQSGPGKERGASSSTSPSPFRWVALDALGDLPLSASGRRIANYLRSVEGGKRRAGVRSSSSAARREKTSEP